MTMNCYETIIIFNGKFTPEEYNALVEHYKSVLKDELSVKLGTTDYIGKKKLAYEIKGIKEGWYVILTYKAKPDIISELERLLRIDDKVIKFMTVRREDDDLDEYAEVEEMPDDHPAGCESEQNTKKTQDYCDLVYNIQ